MVAEQPTSGKIYQAIPAMIAECEHIAKDRKNQQQGFSYRGIDDVYRVVHPLLAKHRVFSCSSILDDQRDEKPSKSGGTLLYARIKMRYRFFADDGSYVDTEVIGEGMDSGDKASNKAMSIAYKYALFQLLCIPVAAIDPDAETHEVAPREVALRQLREEANDKASELKGAKITKEQETTYQAAKDLITAATNSHEVDEAAKCCKKDFDAGKLTKGLFELLGAHCRQKRESLKAMAEQNEFFEKSLA